jgi:hypothetical protein
VELSARATHRIDFRISTVRFRRLVNKRLSWRRLACGNTRRLQLFVAAAHKSRILLASVTARATSAHTVAFALSAAASGSSSSSSRVNLMARAPMRATMSSLRVGVNERVTRCAVRLIRAIVLFEAFVVSSGGELLSFRVGLVEFVLRSVSMRMASSRAMSTSVRLGRTAGQSDALGHLDTSKRDDVGGGDVARPLPHSALRGDVVVVVAFGGDVEQFPPL